MVHTTYLLHIYYRDENVPIEIRNDRLRTIISIRIRGERARKINANEKSTDNRGVIDVRRVSFVSSRTSGVRGLSHYIAVLKANGPFAW